VMAVFIASALIKSCLSSSSTSIDFVLRQAENKKFTKDLKSLGSTHPVLGNSTPSSLGS
jgi:hypothetical protein